MQNSGHWTYRDITQSQPARKLCGLLQRALHGFLGGLTVRKGGDTSVHGFPDGPMPVSASWSALCAKLWRAFGREAPACAMVSALIGILLLQSVTAYSEMRMWTGINGVMIHGEYVSSSSEQIELRGPDGTVITTSSRNLSEADRKYVRQKRLLDTLAALRKSRDDYEEGIKHYLGEGAPQDFVRAVQFFRRSVAATRDGSPLANRDALFSLGLAYSDGTGVDVDRAQARTYFRRSAELGHIGAQNNLARLLDLGQGGPVNNDEALYWYKKAAEHGSPNALYNLGLSEKQQNNTSVAADYFTRSGEAYLANTDREGALRSVDRLREMGFDQAAKDLMSRVSGSQIAQPSSSDTVMPTYRGTGWFCSARHVATCWHVVENRNRIHVVSERLPKTAARVLVKDAHNDLAILALDEDSQEAPNVLSMATSGAAAGDRVFTVGFPHVDILGTAAKYSDGAVSAASGMDDDPRVFQISVPVQSGNSGGPLVNVDGQVVGVIESKLAAERVFDWTGDMPQNVNFAVKAVYLQALMDSRGIAATRDTGARVSPHPEIVERVQSAVVLVIAE